MKEFIDKEKAGLQALFEPFNEGGSWMSLVEPGRDAVRLGVVDALIFLPRAAKLRPQLTPFSRKKDSYFLSVPRI